MEYIYLGSLSAKRNNINIIAKDTVVQNLQNHLIQFSSGDVINHIKVHKIKQINIVAVPIPTPITRYSGAMVYDSPDVLDILEIQL